MYNFKQTKLFNKVFASKISLLLVLVCGFTFLFLLPIKSFSQSIPNPISLSVPLVNVGDKRFETKLLGQNSWIYDGSLADNDLIRFGWTGNKVIDIDCKTNVRANCGYIKVYLNDDTNENNFITDNSTSPLAINKVSSKLTPGFNKIMLVYVEPNNEKSTSKVLFSFNYKTIKEQPQISILEPSQGALFMSEKSKSGGVKFKIELSNFKLTPSGDNLPDSGVLKLFINENKSKPLVTIKNSKDLGNSRQLVEFSSNDFDPDVSIPDSKNTILSFALFKGDGTNMEVSASRQVVTNYGKTLLDIGIPEVNIIEPKADRVDLSVDGERKFIFEVKNFELLDKITSGDNDPKKGYLQIFIDDLPVQIIWPKLDFTLNEIEYSDISDGKKNIRIQLVNKDFTRLSPEASANLDFIYKNTINDSLNNNNSSLQVDSTNWRLIFIGLVVLIILVGIALLVFKG